MNRSEQISDLAAALAKAQAEIVGAKKDSENPHFRSKYADLASVWEACRTALTKHGLSVYQAPRFVHVGEGWLVEVETTLMHATGQFLTDSLALPVTKQDAQGVGSAITYARRYALAAAVGVAPEDDDAEGAIGPRNGAQAKDAAPNGALNVATFKVTDIGAKDMGGWTRYTIKGDDGGVYQSRNVKHATEAKNARAAGASIEVTYKTSQFGRDLVTVKEVEGTADPKLEAVL